MGKTSRLVNCPYCFKEMNAQGLGGHVFAIHGIRSQQVSKPVNLTLTPVGTTATPVQDKSTYPEYQCADVKTPLGAPIRNSDKDNKVTVRSDPPEYYPSEVKRLYTEDDLWHVLGKLARVKYLENASNLLNLLNTADKCDKIVKEFETRFQCKLSDARKLFPKVDADGITRGPDDYAYRKIRWKKVRITRYNAP